MTLDPRRVRAAEPMPRILVVDDDRRVLELLEIALSAHGFRVLTAGDGEEAIQRAVGDRPDLVVLDVRLPRKSGLEVCEWLRRDPMEPHVPIILVSAAIETEARLQAFRRGADDYLSKPFSPKELVARVKRLLARSAEARESRERVIELERDLLRVRGEAKRAHEETRREMRIRELAFGPGREWQTCLDGETLARRVLAAAQSRIGADRAVLLTAPRRGTPLTPEMASGVAFDQVSGIALDPAGALASFLASLGRPARRRDLERVPDLREELGPFIAFGAEVLAPLRGPEGLESVLVLGERHDGRDPETEELLILEALCDLAAPAFANARRIRALMEVASRYTAERVTGVTPAAALEASLQAAGDRLDDAMRHALAGLLEETRPGEAKASRSGFLRASKEESKASGSRSRPWAPRSRPA